MVEIYNYSASVYENHISSTKIVDAFRKEIQMSASSIRNAAHHTRILDLTPKLPAIVTLLQTDHRTHWAHFSPPKQYFSQRISSSYLVPSLGSPAQQTQDMNKILSYLDILTNGRFSYDDREQQEDDLQEEHHDQQNRDEQEEPYSHTIKEGETLLRMLDIGIQQTNLMIDFVIARILQFVQG